MVLIYLGVIFRENFVVDKLTALCDLLLNFNGNGFVCDFSVKVDFDFNWRFFIVYVEFCWVFF